MHTQVFVLLLWLISSRAFTPNSRKIRSFEVLSSHKKRPTPIEERLNKLGFNYERKGNRTGVRFRPVDYRLNDDVATLQGTLEGVRIRSPVDTSPSYIRFRCAKGHEWKASPGSYVSIECPVCDQKHLKRKSKNQKSAKKARYKGTVRRQVMDYALSRGGSVSNKSQKPKWTWTGKVDVECAHGHQWTASCSSLVNYRTWCRKCQSQRRRLTVDDLHATAAHFHGSFLGFVDEKGDVADGEVTQIARENPPNEGVGLGAQTALWKCQQGHMFTRRANHIRRKAKTRAVAMESSSSSSSSSSDETRVPRRKCSWCPDCARDGLQFSWDPLDAKSGGWTLAEHRTAAVAAVMADENGQVPGRF